MVAAIASSPAETAEKSAGPPEKAPGKSVTLTATDVSGQKTVRFKIRPQDSETTVDELIDGLIPRMQLQSQVEGRPLTYGARLEREGRHLHGSERVADAVREGDQLVLSPSINAG